MPSSSSSSLPSLVPTAAKEGGTELEKKKK
jgi:hypothetical protein